MDESGPIKVIPPADAKAEKGLRYVCANGVIDYHADKEDASKNVDGITFVGSDGKVFVNRSYLPSDPEDIILLREGLCARLARDVAGLPIRVG